MGPVVLARLDLTPQLDLSEAMLKQLVLLQRLQR